MAPAMEIESNMQNLHFVLVPLLAQGHMIPMIDMTKLFAKRGVRVTLVITPNNALRSARAIRRARDSGLPIRVLEIPFPSKEVGLPPGCENLDSVPSKDLLRPFYRALDKLQGPLEKYLRENEYPPSCIISDKCLSWTSETAKKFQVPRIVFHGMCSFSLLSSHNVSLHRPHLAVDSDQEPFIIPGMPMRVEITRAKLPGSFVTLPCFNDIRDQMTQAESNAYGVVVNTFAELEHGCVEEYRKAINKKVWCIGPVSQCNKQNLDKFERGNPSSIDKNLIGVRVGVELPVRWGDEERVGVLVSKEQVEIAIERLMKDPEDGMERGVRARELALTAKNAMEDGGSTSFSISLLINDIMGQVRLRTS
ncbi:OLC1v1034423C1 [Oldenlandia corymbosa var. corymbosa]|uniref:OLC1v1034423C1 n=1 Tax=Oldenlandia corymbosa var. corymbosa TaxID=529605 RepID=A0AAV1CQK7_OLDCO|nr:OLC1v1034423C1 [Oldenlandia corymbosa var. corymbosa]